MPTPTRITLPPSGRPVGGILAAARPTGAAEWWRGVKFTSGQCLAPQNYGPCASDDAVQKEEQNLSTEAEFQAFSILQAVKCSTLGRTAIDVFAGQALDVTREFGVASELLTGAATGNPSLGDATTLTAASDPAAALGCLEQVASLALSGRMAFIHVTPAIGTALLAAAAIWSNGAPRRWYTAAGNTVVISPGYDGRQPGAGAPGAGDPLYMYATGEVYAEVGSADQREILQSVERSQNTIQATAEDTAIVLFDPCFVVAIDSGLNACTSGS